MHQTTQYQQRRPTAFISCSLRAEDKPFVDYVEAIIRQMGFTPVGTVGRYDAAPKPIWEQMRDNIKSADCIVLAATPRYLQQDINDKARTGRGMLELIQKKAMSEMLHTEVAMAVAMDRPVLAFVLEGTEVGNFLPQAVQYIVLKGDRSDFFAKWPLIKAYFANAAVMIEKRWSQESRAGLLKVAVGGLAAIGGAALLSWLGSDADEEDAEYSDEDDDDETGYDEDE
jgi:hypothetical protein